MTGKVITIGEKPQEINVVTNSTASLNIGCGSLALEGWENIDSDISLINWFKTHNRELLSFFKVKDALKDFNYADESVDRIYLSNFIEHLEPIECRKLLTNCHNSLKNDGRIRIVVPDMSVILNKYDNGKMDDFNEGQPEMFDIATSPAKLAYMLFGNLYNADPKYQHGNHYLGHKMAYNYSSLRDLLVEIGFKDIVIYEQTGSSKVGSSKVFQDVYYIENHHLPMWYMLIAEAGK